MHMIEVIKKIKLFSKDFLISCSFDKLIKIWNISNINDIKLFKTFNGHTGSCL